VSATLPCRHFGPPAPLSTLARKESDGANMLSTACSSNGKMPRTENPFFMIDFVNAFFNERNTHYAKVSLEAGSFKFLDIQKFMY
jgi:hypothetical protein